MLSGRRKKDYEAEASANALAAQAGALDGSTDGEAGLVDASEPLAEEATAAA
jgi:hypothetical protein